MYISSRNITIEFRNLLPHRRYNGFHQQNYAPKGLNVRYRQLEQFIATLVYLRHYTITRRANSVCLRGGDEEIKFAYQD